MSDSEKTIKVSEFEEAIRKSSKTLTVAVPAIGMNRIHNRWEELEINYVDSEELLKHLMK